MDSFINKTDRRFVFWRSSLLVRLPCGLFPDEGATRPMEPVAVRLTYAQHRLLVAESRGSPT
jgi:hypothetical protein